MRKKKKKKERTDLVSNLHQSIESDRDRKAGQLNSECNCLEQYSYLDRAL
jgi:hypothetical protein